MKRAPEVTDADDDAVDDAAPVSAARRRLPLRSIQILPCRYIHGLFFLAHGNFSSDPLQVPPQPS